MPNEPIVGKPVRFPPGRVRVHLDAGQRSTYRALYARYRTFLDDLPVLRDRDFDGRGVLMTEAQLEALNRGLASVAASDTNTQGVFDAQERAKSRLFKKLQYLS